MSIPNLTPKRTTSAIVLPSTGTVGDDSTATGYADSAAKTLILYPARLIR